MAGRINTNAAIRRFASPTLLANKGDSLCKYQRSGGARPTGVHSTFWKSRRLFAFNG